MAWNRTAREICKRKPDRYESDLTDGEQLLIEPLLPEPMKLGRPRSADLREVFNAVLRLLSAGCQWRAVRGCFQPFATVQNCFRAWRGNGVMERMTDALRDAGRSAEPTAAGIGSRPVKTAGMGGPSGYDAGRKIKGRKRHIAVDAEGIPITVRVHPADVQDRDGAPDVIIGMLKKAPEVEKVRSDSGYRGGKLRLKLAGPGVPEALEIVERPEGIRGFTVLCRRWAAARTFAWMPRRRRLAKDFERTLESSAAWAQLAACRFLMRRLARAETNSRKQLNYNNGL